MGRLIAGIGKHFIWIAILGVQARAAEPIHAAAPQPQPLANALLSPALRAAAERDQIDLAAKDCVEGQPAAGDAVVLWIGAAQDGESRQWLVQLKRGIATPEEQKAHRGRDVTKYLSWGSVVVFHSEVEAVDLWIAGPVKVIGEPVKDPKTVSPARIRRLRVFVPRDYLRLGLDESERVDQFMSWRFQAIRKEDPKFTLGHIYALDRPIKPENIAYAKPVAERVGFTPEMGRAWMGGYVALQAFYELVNDVPALREIADIAMERPAPWKMVKLAFGTKFKTSFGGGNSQPIDPAKAGLLPVAYDSFEMPVSFSLGDNLIVSGVVAVTAPVPPLDVSAGILGLIAVHPKDRTRVVELVAISAQRGAAKERR
jgi:hypothetical protein